MPARAQMKESVRRWTFAALFLVGLALVGYGQVLLIHPPITPANAPAWMRALEPIWPDCFAATVSLALFIVGSAFFAVSTRQLLREVPLERVIVPFHKLTRRSPLLIAVGLSGLALYSFLLYRLIPSPNAPSYGAGFLYSWGLMLGALFWSEGRAAYWPSAQSPRRIRIWESTYVVLMSAAFFWLNTFDLRSWYYSCLGDEFSFRVASAQVAEGRPWVPNLFIQRGVHNAFPVMSTWFTGLLMRL